MWRGDWQQSSEWLILRGPLNFKKYFQFFSPFVIRFACFLHNIVIVFNS